MIVKHRLESAPLTAEDRAIWFGVIVGRLPQMSMAGHISKLHDRRDADLMYKARFKRRFEDTPIHVVGIDCGGRLP